MVKRVQGEKTAAAGFGVASRQCSVNRFFVNSFGSNRPFFFI
jgi:hypothetical protein